MEAKVRAKKLEGMFIVVKLIISVKIDTTSKFISRNYSIVIVQAYR